MLSIFAKSATNPVPLHAVMAKDVEAFLTSRADSDVRWLKSASFRGKDNELVLVPGSKGGIAAAVLGLGAGRDLLALALFAERLPAGDYALGDVPAPFGGKHAALAWALGTYSFDRYRAQTKKDHPRLVLPEGVDGEAISRIAAGVFLARDLVNTPSNDMGPAELEAAARKVADAHGAKVTVTTGDALLAANYPLVHAVGRASAREPRLIDLRWGSDTHPKVTLVGKGVCFDSGGLDLKNAAGMLTMKKDMGGGASVIALAQMIMDAKLPVRLRVLVPAVENSVSGTAYRPGDVLPSRKGLTVEIGNTDAEGRLVLADALVEADSEKPDVLFCIATLTGAARAATGMELPPFFTDDEKLAADLARHATAEHDPMWRLPLWRSYEGAIESSVADLNNAPEYGLAGAIMAALFLDRFVTGTKSWAHFDIPAWIDRPKPGRKKGAEANVIRALYVLLAERYGESRVNAFDPRLTPARADLAAAYLMGKVEAARFAEGEIKQAIRGNVALRDAPSFDAQLHTEILFGEIFTVYEEKNGWAWGQCALDSYVGYARASEFASPGPAPTHRVSVFKTPLQPAHDVQRDAVDFLPMNAKVCVLDEEDRYARVADNLYVFSGHLVSIAARTPDWVAVAERFIGIPYLWGGKTVDGVDCSGVIQLALEAGGIKSPRDADMMEAVLGKPVPVTPDLSNLKRGDILFWNEHVGVMVDANRMLHANGFHMMVEVEPLRDALTRIARPITSIKRL